MVLQHNRAMVVATRVAPPSLQELLVHLHISLTRRGKQKIYNSLKDRTVQQKKERKKNVPFCSTKKSMPPQKARGFHSLLRRPRKKYFLGFRLAAAKESLRNFWTV